MRGERKKFGRNWSRMVEWKGLEAAETNLRWSYYNFLNLVEYAIPNRQVNNDLRELMHAEIIPYSAVKIHVSIIRGLGFAQYILKKRSASLTINPSIFTSVIQCYSATLVFMT